MESIVEMNKFSNDNNDRSLISLSTIFIILAIILGCFILMISEILLWLITSFIPNIWIIIAIYIIMHLLVLRHIISIGIFPGHNRFIKFYFALEQSRYDSKDYIKVLIRLKKNICFINDKPFISSIEDKNIIAALKTDYDKFISIYMIYQEIKKKCGDLGYYANKFHIQILNAYDQIFSSIIPSIVLLYDNNKEINKTIEVYSEDKKILHKINNELNEVIDLIKESFENNSSWNPLKLLKNLFYNDIFWKKEYLRIKALALSKNITNYEEFNIKSKDQTKLDCVLLKSKPLLIEGKNNLMIMCCPNLMTLEQLIISWDFNRLYLSNHTDVLLWNYRGYRNSNGSSNLNNVKIDIESIYDYLKIIHRWDKIGIHGISIGGVPACYLATIRPIDILIADRIPGSIDKIGQQLPCGNFIWLLFQILCIPKVFNESYFINAKCYKIILNDPNDMIIKESISLKSAIAQVLLEEMHLSLVKTGKEHLTFNTKRHSQNKNLIHYALLPQDQKLFYSSLIKIYTFMKQYKNNTLKNHQLNKYSNQDNNKRNADIYSLITTNSNDFADFFYNKIRFFMLGFDSSGISLVNILDSNLPIEYIDIFINNLIIWGSQDYSISINQEYLKLSSNASIEKSFNNFIRGLESIIDQEDDPRYSGYDLLDHLKNFIEGLRKIELYIQEINIKEYNTFLSKLKGVLITLSCGHTSFYKENELETLHYLLSKEFNNHY